MPNMNRVFLMGNLTRDPELRHIPSGRAVADMRLAVSEKYKNKDGELVESACFVDLVAWGRQAELCGQYLAKGSPIMTEGKLQLDSWETDDGQKRSKIRVQAFRVQFLGRNGDSADSHSESNPEESNEHEQEAADMPF